MAIIDQNCAKLHFSYHPSQTSISCNKCLSSQTWHVPKSVDNSADSTTFTLSKRFCSHLRLAGPSNALKEHNQAFFAKFNTFCQIQQRQFHSLLTIYCYCYLCSEQHPIFLLKNCRTENRTVNTVWWYLTNQNEIKLLKVHISRNSSKFLC